jgi:sigma-B regulation protein RsbU (phosphoserine phosphatase)
MLTLHITHAEGEAFEHPVEGDSVVIGRSTRCDLALADRFLSRRHARLLRIGNVWHVEDLGSRNGTFVNGTRVSEATPVGPGDVINMSASVVRVVRGPADSSDVWRALSSTSDVLLRPASDVLLSIQTPPPAATATQNDLTRYAERLSIVNEVHQALARSISLDELLELILDRVFQHLRPEQGAIFLRDKGGAYRRAASRLLPGVACELVYSESLVHEVAEKGMAAVVLDTSTDRRFAQAKSLLDAGVRSLVAAPLLDEPHGTLGMIVLGSNAATRRFAEEDLELLVTLASIATLRIRNLALAEEAVEHRRLEDELEIARRIQVALLPETLPEVAGYGLYGATLPSRMVSGDYFEVVPRADGREIVLLLADVSGKGIAASLLTAYIEALSSAPIQDGLPPHEIFARVSNTLYRRTPANRFATMILAVLEPTTGLVRYCNAGHLPACLIRAAGEVEWLEPTGLPLGLFPDAEYVTDETFLKPGDTLVLYSDGYTEAENPAEEQFGESRLGEVCAANSGIESENLARAIDAAVERFANGQAAVDDRTIVIVRREPG